MAARVRYVVSYIARSRRWRLTRKGESSAEYVTQHAAIQAGAALGRALWRNGQEAELIVKARNGRIRDNRTYGNDPRGGG